MFLTDEGAAVTAFLNLLGQWTQSEIEEQLRHRVESIIAFSDGFVVGAQKDQLRRYNEIKQTEMPMAEAAKKTREFRCPPHEQVLVVFTFTDNVTDTECT